MCIPIKNHARWYYTIHIRTSLRSHLTGLQKGLWTKYRLHTGFIWITLLQHGNDQYAFILTSKSSILNPDYVNCLIKNYLLKFLQRAQYFTNTHNSLDAKRRSPEKVDCNTTNITIMRRGEWQCQPTSCSEEYYKLKISLYRMINI